MMIWWSYMTTGCHIDSGLLLILMIWFEVEGIELKGLWSKGPEKKEITGKYTAS